MFNKERYKHLGVYSMQTALQKLIVLIILPPFPYTLLHD